jgi:hypothetical protein
LSCGKATPAVSHLTRGTSSKGAGIVKTSSPTHPAAKGGCTPGSTAFCLNGGRFRVEVDWTDFQGGQGQGQVVPFDVDDSGLFWFFGPNNWEMLVKVLDGCRGNNHFWVFSAATTNVEYTLTVTDTVQGTVVRYTNPLGTSASAITDTSAFATCDPP